MKKLLVALTICGMVAGCGGGSGSLGGGSGSLSGSSGSGGSANSSAGGSSAGSFGLFKRQKSEPLNVTQQAAIKHGDMIPIVADVWIEQVKGGAIVRAKGKASRQGYYDVKLLAPGGLKPDEKGVITLEFRAKQPEFWTAASTERAREIIVGRFISQQKLAQTQTIQVLAAQNQITIKR
ncbi:MAG: hypothetical protein KUG74_07685 [Rhodobacteraceae bacterium]|nr:hypothetical protein [Paracoccaceae bacterium]